jgi:hypothetical protein
MKTIAIAQHPAEGLADSARCEYRAPRQQAAATLLGVIELTLDTSLERLAKEQREASPQ